MACSFWARELAEPFGLNLPIYPLQNHIIITEAVPELEALDFEVPTARDPWAPSVTRLEGHGFLCGIYESQPEFWATDGIPPDFVEELLPDDTERLEPHLLRVMERMPAFGHAGIKVVNNGPICCAPDGCPCWVRLKVIQASGLPRRFPWAPAAGPADFWPTGWWMARHPMTFPLFIPPGSRASYPAMPVWP